MTTFLGTILYITSCYANFEVVIINSCFLVHIYMYIQYIAYRRYMKRINYNVKYNYSPLTIPVRCDNYISN